MGAAVELGSRPQTTAFPTGVPATPQHQTQDTHPSKSLIAHPPSSAPAMGSTAPLSRAHTQAKLPMGFNISWPGRPDPASPGHAGGLQEPLPRAQRPHSHPPTTQSPASHGLGRPSSRSLDRPLEADAIHVESPQSARDALADAAGTSVQRPPDRDTGQMLQSPPRNRPRGHSANRSPRVAGIMQVRSRSGHTSPAAAGSGADLGYPEAPVMVPRTENGGSQVEGPIRLMRGLDGNHRGLPSHAPPEHKIEDPMEGGGLPVFPHSPGTLHLGSIPPPQRYMPVVEHSVSGCGTGPAATPSAPPSTPSSAPFRGTNTPIHKPQARAINGRKRGSNPEVRKSHDSLKPTLSRESSNGPMRHVALQPLHSPELAGSGAEAQTGV